MKKIIAENPLIWIKIDWEKIRIAYLVTHGKEPSPNIISQKEEIVKLRCRNYTFFDFKELLRAARLVKRFNSRDLFKKFKEYSVIYSRICWYRQYRKWIPAPEYAEGERLCPLSQQQRKNLCIKWMLRGSNLEGIEKFRKIYEENGLEYLLSFNIDLRVDNGKIIIQIR